MAIFGPKPWVNPFGKMSIFRFFKLLVFKAQKRRFFWLQNIVKDIFLASIALKVKLKKWPVLDQNHGLTPLEKCQFFDFLNFLFLKPRKAFFWLQNIVKDIFLASIALKVKLEKWPVLDQNHGLTPLEKCQFFDFLNFLFLQPRKTCFGSRISCKTFSWPILPKKEKLEKSPFLDQNHGLTPLEKCQFFDFLNFLFLQPRKAFSALEYRQRHFPGLYCLKRKVEKMAIF